VRILLSIGSNLGNRETLLREAVEALGREPAVHVTASSSQYETEPVGVVDQPPFLNMAVEIETDLEPLELLDAVKCIERKLGRIPSERWGPRHIDIDIVLWGGRVMETERLTLPHREFRRRAFVLVPLAEIAPDAMDPVSGKTVAALTADLESHDGVRRLGTK
jgi:2-amino-4-hydroxy-6-hydroxymethyldihydropteridine diphosphokinase